MSASYLVDTLSQMAEIPEEVQPRFIAELPFMLAEMRRMRAVRASFNSAFDGALNMVPIEGVTWVDDDKGEINTTISVSDLDEKVTVTRKFGVQS